MSADELLRRCKAALQVLNSASPPADSLRLAEQQWEGLKEVDPSDCFRTCTTLVNSADDASSAIWPAEMLATLCRNPSCEPESSWPISLLGVLAAAADQGRAPSVIDALAGAFCALVVRLRSLRAEHIPLLKAILDEGSAAIERVYGVAADQLRVYLHYQPQVKST